MKPSLMLLLVAAGAGCLNPCAPPFRPANECSKSDNGVLSGLAIGPADPYEYQPAPFQPWQDGDGVALVRGGQGAQMIVARIEVSGDGGSCLGQETVVRDETGVELAAERSPVLTEPSVDARGVAIAGFVDTHALFLPGDYPKPGARVVVTASAGGLSVSRTLVIVPSWSDLAAPSDLATDLGSDLSSSDGL